ncbi:hypothetical protein [Crocosphaera sp.]|uniref:hypothetical protein n=1 Tax=Crocosphaera sp. TaxID=2729996 RepID=UPI0026123C35|nr:hypothetical protein [Crocosphaera sp.]MDJ0582822.1 hypothetical protein [Crocosphaera sp.]
MGTILDNTNKIGEIIKELPILPGRKKPVGRFWQKFAEKEKVTIILSEYESSPTTELGSTEAIRTAINRHSVSMGNAKAMASLLSFFSKDRRFNFTPNVQGSESREASPYFTGSNLILLGSEISNQVAREKIEDLRREGAIIPYEVRENQETNIIEIRHITNPEEIYVPQIDKDGSGTDYALIIKTKNPSDFESRELIILAGANMYGVEAAARIITKPNQLEEINRQISNNNCQNIWILIKTEVKFFSPNRATIIGSGTLTMGEVTQSEKLSEAEQIESLKKDFWDELDEVIEDCKINTGIKDLSYQHDHYIHGTPKRDIQ